ncbi:hypothetical protein P692DRAFT_20802989 [Suillus brevipes Sb2]|nr:hypothetical protein P692DRAFT_20802989 [Suillus brevipes Sb2]
MRHTRSQCVISCWARVETANNLSIPPAPALYPDHTLQHSSSTRPHPPLTRYPPVISYCMPSSSTHDLHHRTSTHLAALPLLHLVLVQELTWRAALVVDVLTVEVAMAIVLMTGHLIARLG